MRTVSRFCRNCEETTLQKEVYEDLDDGSADVYLTTCTVCNKDV